MRPDRLARSTTTSMRAAGSTRLSWSSQKNSGNLACGKDFDKVLILRIMIMPKRQV